jgi:1-acyl-sn-glycerol-3-phosphate acyltransferase
MNRTMGTIRILLAALFTTCVAVGAILSLALDAGRGRIYHGVARFWSRGVLRICGIHLSVRGAEHLVPGKTYVYVSNHASLFDIPVVIAGVPDQIRLVYKKELQKIPIFGWSLRWGAYVAIDRRSTLDAKRSVEDAAEKIRRGASVLLFAEGTRSPDGRLQSFKRGAFNLAVKSGVPVIPLTINGTFRILPKSSLAIHPGPVELILDRPIEISADAGKDAERELLRRVHEVMVIHYRDQSEPTSKEEECPSH